MFQPAKCAASCRPPSRANARRRNPNHGPRAVA
jgi:hypothetical protein